MLRNALHLAQWKLKDEGGRSVDKMVGGLDIDLETQDKVAEEMLIGLLILIGKVLNLCKASSDSLLF